MILFPAIDLKDGMCVRLRRGALDSATVFSDDPAGQAQSFAQQGFTHLHVVDLNGAFEGRSVNGESVRAILGASPAKIQLGGGLRTMADIEYWLELGVWRVILGTAAVRDPDLVRAAARAFPEQIAVGIDVRDGHVAVQGWAESSDMPAHRLVERMQEAGACAVIVTDIGRDGMKSGVNLELTGSVSAAVCIPVIASGGVASLDDLKRLKGVASGAILGRALYDGDIEPCSALALVEASA